MKNNRSICFKLIDYNRLENKNECNQLITIRQNSTMKSIINRLHFEGIVPMPDIYEYFLIRSKESVYMYIILILKITSDQ